MEIDASVFVGHFPPILEEESVNYNIWADAQEIERQRFVSVVRSWSSVSLAIRSRPQRTPIDVKFILTQV